MFGLTEVNRKIDALREEIKSLMSIGGRIDGIYHVLNNIRDKIERDYKRRDSSSIQPAQTESDSNPKSQQIGSDKLKYEIHDPRYTEVYPTINEGHLGLSVTDEPVNEESEFDKMRKYMCMDSGKYDTQFVYKYSDPRSRQECKKERCDDGCKDNEEKIKKGIFEDGLVTTPKSGNFFIEENNLSFEQAINRLMKTDVIRHHEFYENMFIVNVDGVFLSPSKDGLIPFSINSEHMSSNGWCVVSMDSALINEITRYRCRKID